MLQEHLEKGWNIIGFISFFLIFLFFIGTTCGYSKDIDTSEVSPYVFKVVSSNCPTCLVKEETAQTGFIVQGGAGIITALHGVVKRKNISATDHKGKEYSALEIVKVDIERDLALLSFDKYSGKGLRKPEQQPDYRGIYSVGYPFGLPRQKITSHLSIHTPPFEQLWTLLPARLTEIAKERDSPSADLNVLSIEGHLLPGHSGAPVLNEKNQVIGVANGGLQKGAAGISWAIPYNQIKWTSVSSEEQELMRIAGLEAPVSSYSIFQASKTILRWQEPVPSKMMTWEEANEYVEQKNRDELMGHHDWRLPTTEELQEFYRVIKNSPKSYFDADKLYWASRKLDLDSSKVTVVNLKNARIEWDGTDQQVAQVLKNKKFAVRLIRNLKSLTIYPDLQREVLHPGDPVVFEFTSTRAAIDINSVQINPGEPGAPLLGCGRNAVCTENTIRGYYTYKKRGYYNISVQQHGQVLAGEQILILEDYLTDEELRYETIKGIAAELQPVLQKFARGKVAFSALKDANFEYADDQRDVKIIYGLMQALMENNAGRRSNYVILERAPHALVRLAHEAVYTVPKNSNNPKKQRQLEYELYTLNRGLKEPLVYGINPSGLDDRTVRIDTKGGVTIRNKGENKNRKIKTGNDSLVRRDNKKGTSSLEEYRNRPVMFARFDTADFLVVIERLEDGPVQRSAADYYDPTYNTKAIKRTAKIKVNVRILDDNGRILWIKNIANQVSDLVMPDYAPPVQAWTESKNRIPVQDTNAPGAMIIDPITGLLKAAETIGKIASPFVE